MERVLKSLRDRIDMPKAKRLSLSKRSGYTLAIITVGCLAGCVTTTDRNDPRFAVRTFGEVFPLTKTVRQRSHVLPEVTRQTFREITIAQGSGFAGYDAIRIFSDGSGYAVAAVSESRACRLPLQLSAQQLDLLIRAIHEDKLGRINALYSSGIDDGAQGFVELVTAGGRVATGSTTTSFPFPTYTPSAINRFGRA